MMHPGSNPYPLGDNHNQSAMGKVENPEQKIPPVHNFEKEVAPIEHHSMMNNMGQHSRLDPGAEHNRNRSMMPNIEHNEENPFN